MADEIENHTIRLLQEMRVEWRDRFSRIDERLDRMAEDVRGLKVRVTSSEENAAGANRRLDRIEDRLERIEKRLDLVDA